MIAGLLVRRSLVRSQVPCSSNACRTGRRVITPALLPHAGEGESNGCAAQTPERLRSTCTRQPASLPSVASGRCPQTRRPRAAAQLVFSSSGTRFASVYDTSQPQMANDPKQHGNAATVGHGTHTDKEELHLRGRFGQPARLNKRPATVPARAEEAHLGHSIVVEAEQALPDRWAWSYLIDGRISSTGTERFADPESAMKEGLKAARGRLITLWKGNAI